MDKRKQLIALTLVAVLAVLAAGWLLLVSPKRADVADLSAQATAQRQASEQLRTRLAVLRGQAARLPEQRAEIAAVAQKIPSSTAVPELVRALTAAARSAGVELVSVAPTAPVPVTAAGAPATAPTTGAVHAPGTPVAAVTSLSSMSVATQVVGGYYGVEQFLDRLEGLARAYKVISVNLAPGANPMLPSTSAAADRGNSISATVTGLVYVAANRAPLPGAAAPAPAARATAATTTTAAGR